MYYQDASWLDTAGRLLMVAFFLAVGLRNLQKVHIEDHVKRLTNFKAPFPRITFWVGQAMEFVGCALVLFNWYPAVGVVLLLVFTVVAMTLDNFLRPILIRMGADLPLLLILAGVIGGLVAFGLIGIFLGPTILAVGYTLLRAWIDEDGSTQED